MGHSLSALARPRETLTNSADGFIRVGAVLDGQRRHAENVRDVGNAGAFPPLVLVHLVGVHHRCFESERRQREAEAFTSRWSSRNPTGISVDL